MKQMIEFLESNNRKVMLDASKVGAFMEAYPKGLGEGTVIYLVGDGGGIFVKEKYESVKQKLSKLNT